MRGNQHGPGKKAASLDAQAVRTICAWKSFDVWRLERPGEAPLLPLQPFCLRPEAKALTDWLMRMIAMSGRLTMLLKDSSMVLVAVSAVRNVVKWRGMVRRLAAAAHTEATQRTCGRTRNDPPSTLTQPPLLSHARLGISRYLHAHLW